ncbi:MAG: L-lactate permease [Clostridia bacterium]|nr:L-lactate permease [Clostridia bacterium]
MADFTVPVDALHWIAAIAPIIILLLLLVWGRWGAAEAGSVTWFLVAIVSVVIYKVPMDTLALETVKGVWSAIFSILIIVWPAILIYEVTNEADAFVPFRKGIERVTPNRLLQIMAFSWGFAGFLQGITGFGVPVAITAPLLVGIGVKPLYAVIFCLIGHAWNNTFGTLSVAWLALREVTALPQADAMVTALWAGAFIWLFNIVAGLTICWLYGKAKGIKEGLPAVIVISLMQGGGTLVLSQWNDHVNGFIAGLLGFLVIFILARTPWYSKPSSISPEETPVFMPAAEVAATGETRGKEMGFHLAFSPYYILLALTVGILLIQPIKDFLGQWKIGIPFPATETGYGFVNAATDMYSPFAPLIHGATFLFVSAMIGYFIFNSKGYIKPGGFGRIMARTVEKCIPSTIAMISLTALSVLMRNTGQAGVLAMGVGNTTGQLYAFMSPFVGVLGAFMTGSNTAANILFANFQQTTAQVIGLNEAAILGAQTAGAAAGNTIAPGNVLLGTITVGIMGAEGDVLRVTLKVALGLAVVMGVAIMLVI